MVRIRKYMKDYERVWKYHHEFIMYKCTSTYNIIQLYTTTIYPNLSQSNRSVCGSYNSVHYTTRLLEMENFPLKMGSQTSICRWISEYMGHQLISTTINYEYNQLQYIYIYSYMMIHDTSVYSFAFLECHDVSWVMTVPNTSLTSSVHGSVLLVEPGQGNLSIGKVYRIQPRTVTLHHQLVEPTGFHRQALAQTALADAFRSRFNVFYCCSTLRVRFTCPEG